MPRVPRKAKGVFLITYVCVQSWLLRKATGSQYSRATSSQVNVPNFMTPNIFLSLFLHGMTKSFVCFNVLFQSYKSLIFDETTSNMICTNINRCNCVFSKPIVKLYSYGCWKTGSSISSYTSCFYSTKPCNQVLSTLN